MSASRGSPTSLSARAFLNFHSATTTTTFCSGRSFSRTRYEAAQFILGQMGRGAAPALGRSHPPPGGPEAGEGARQKADRRGAPENSRAGGVEDKGMGRER